MNNLKRIIIATIALALFLNASQRYENSDGVIIDLATTLQWQDKYDNDVPSLDWNNALLYCNNLSLNGYEDWRLPNINELSTIIDYSKPTSIDDIFQTLQGTYWTSTISELNNAYRVQFNIGSVYTYSISNELSVRCVRSSSIKNEILTSINLFNENFKDNTKTTEPFVKSWTFSEDISSFDIEIVSNTYNTILESEFIKDGSILSVELTPNLSNDENKLELRFKDDSGNIVKVDYSDTFWSLTRTQDKDTFNIEELTDSVSITQDNRYSYYSDIEVGDAYFESVVFATLKAVVNGQDDPNDNTKKIFRPNDNVSWAEALKMVINSAAISNEIELPNYEYILNTYPSWAGKYYTYARENNAMSFTSDDLSSTNLTREDIARLLVKVLHLEDRMDGFPKLNGDDIEFSDKNDFSNSEYYEYGKIVRAYGLFMTNDIANPSGSITRAQLAEVVSKIFMIPKAGINTVEVIEYGQTLSIGQLLNKEAMKINGCCATDISSDSSDDIVVQYAVNGVIQSDNSVDTFNLNIGENKIIALVDNNGVREFISKDFIVSYTDSDNDGIQDTNDAWVDDSRYSEDENNNAIPDILDSLYNIGDKSSTDTIVIDGENVNISNLIEDGGYAPNMFLTIENSITLDANTQESLTYSLKDSRGDILSATIIVQTNPAHGEIILNNGTVSYKPNTNYSGSDNFILKFTTASGYKIASVSATVNNIPAPTPAPAPAPSPTPSPSPEPTPVEETVEVVEEEVVEEVIEETPEEEVVEEVIEETPEEEVVEEVVEETPTEEVVETPTKEIPIVQEPIVEDIVKIVASQIDTGLIMGTTSESTDKDGTKTKITEFISESGKKISIENITKIENASTTISGDGTTTTTASATNEIGTTVEAQIQINANGTVQNKVTIGEKVSDMVVAIVGANTTINEDGSMQTLAEVITDEGIKTEASVEVKANGTTANKVEVTNATGEKVTADIDIAIIGADTTVKADGAVETVAEVTTETGLKTKATVEVKADGKTANKVEITDESGEILTTDIEIEIAGANTTVKEDGAVETVAEVTTEEGIKTVSTVEVKADGTTANKVEVTNESGETVTADIAVAIVGANTSVKDNGAIETIASSKDITSGTTTQATVEIKADGTTANKIQVINFENKVVETKMDSAVSGTSSSIANDGAVTIKTPTITTTQGTEVTVEVVSNASGKVKPTITVDEEVVSLPEFEAGSKTNITNTDGKVTIEVETVLTQELEFNKEEL